MATPYTEYEGDVNAGYEQRERDAEERHQSMLESRGTRYRPATDSEKKERFRQAHEEDEEEYRKLEAFRNSPEGIEKAQGDFNSTCELTIQMLISEEWAEPDGIAQEMTLIHEGKVDTNKLLECWTIAMKQLNRFDIREPNYLTKTIDRGYDKGFKWLSKYIGHLEIKKIPMKWYEYAKKKNRSMATKLMQLGLIQESKEDYDDAITEFGGRRRRRKTKRNRRKSRRNKRKTRR
jgi:hypothetical protein